MQDNDKIQHAKKHAKMNTCFLEPSRRAKATYTDPNEITKNTHI